MTTVRVISKHGSQDACANYTYVAYGELAVALSSFGWGWCARLALTFIKINQIYVFCTDETYIDYLCILYINIKLSYLFHLYIIFSYRYRMYM